MGDGEKNNFLNRNKGFWKVFKIKIDQGSAITICCVVVTLCANRRNVNIFISSKYPTRCNVRQFIYICKLLYVFPVVSPPIVRSTYKCIYSIWYLSNCCCYLSLSWKSWKSWSSNSSTITAGSSNGLTSARCCRYSWVCSWWCVEIPPETCRAVSRYR